MHAILVEVGKLVTELEATKLELRNLEREYELKSQEKLNDLRAKMQESLIKSDIAREVAVAKLEAYEKMDSKTDREQISKMLETALDGLVTAASKPVVAQGGGKPQGGGGGNQQKE